MNCRVALALLLLAGCDSWDPAISARTLAAQTLSCESVEMTPTGENRWHATGCGQETDVACTAAQLEPHCTRFRTAGGQVATDDEDTTPHATPTVAESEAALYAQPEQNDPDMDRAADEDSPALPPPPEAPSAAETVIRNGLDAHRADIYACTQHDPTVLRVRYDVDGELDIHLAGGMEGSPEEGCVRAALSGARAPEGSSGTVLHLVHGP